MGNLDPRGHIFAVCCFTHSYQCLSTAKTDKQTTKKKVKKELQYARCLSPECAYHFKVFLLKSGTSHDGICVSMCACVPSKELRLCQKEGRSSVYS